MTNFGVDEDSSLVVYDTVSIGKYLPTLRDGISQIQRMKAASSIGMLPISTVLSQDFVQISETKCEGRSD
jgi:hypothetical protein